MAMGSNSTRCSVHRGSGGLVSSRRRNRVPADRSSADRAGRSLPEEANRTGRRLVRGSMDCPEDVVAADNDLASRMKGRTETMTSGEEKSGADAIIMGAPTPTTSVIRCGALFRHRKTPLRGVDERGNCHRRLLKARARKRCASALGMTPSAGVARVERMTGRIRSDFTTSLRLGDAEPRSAILPSPSTGSRRTRVD